MVFLLNNLDNNFAGVDAFSIARFFIKMYFSK